MPRIAFAILIVFLSIAVLTLPTVATAVSRHRYLCDHLAAISRLESELAAANAEYVTWANATGQLTRPQETWTLDEHAAWQSRETATWRLVDERSAAIDAYNAEVRQGGGFGADCWPVIGADGGIGEMP